MRAPTILSSSSERLASGERTIGPIGTASRVLLGLLALYLALIDGPPFADGFSWGLEWWDAVLGVLVLPGLMILVGLRARHDGSPPLRLLGPGATAVNCLVIVALVANPYTAGGALLFYGVAMLIAAWKGQAGCEATVISNLVLGRDDQIGCPTFTPIDEAEARMRRPSAAHSSR